MKGVCDIMATLKVNLSTTGNACKQDKTDAGEFPGPGWYAFLKNCDGTQFVNADKEYGPFPIDHGYVEIKDVPPGRYLLFAILNPFIVSDAGSATTPTGKILIYQANYASHFAVVDVCCGCHDICVTLYNSGWHYCVKVIIHWLKLLASLEQIKPSIAQNTIQALNAVLKETGEELPTDRAINKHIAELTDIFEGSKSREKY